MGAIEDCFARKGHLHLPTGPNTWRILVWPHCNCSKLSLEICKLWVPTLAPEFSPFPIASLSTNLQKTNQTHILKPQNHANETFNIDAFIHVATPFCSCNSIVGSHLTFIFVGRVCRLQFQQETPSSGNKLWCYSSHSSKKLLPCMTCSSPGVPAAQTDSRQLSPACCSCSQAGSGSLPSLVFSDPCLPTLWDFIARIMAFNAFLSVPIPRLRKLIYHSKLKWDSVLLWGKVNLEKHEIYWLTKVSHISFKSFDFF